jgi:hypothetical protein
MQNHSDWTTRIERLKGREQDIALLKDLYILPLNE